MPTDASPWSRPEPVYRLLATVLGLAMRILFRIRVEGAEHLPRRGAALLAPNHVSYIDPVVVGVSVTRLGRRVRFFAGEGGFAHPVAGPALRGAHQLPVRRGHGIGAATEPARAALAAGEVVVIYPEGTVPPSGTRPPARSGVGLLALRCRVPVIPVAQWGMHRRGGRYRPRPRRPAAVVLGPPVDLSAWEGRDDPEAHDAASEAVMAATRALLPRAQTLARG